MELIFEKRTGEEENVPGILYGPGIRNTSFEVNGKELKSIYKKAGESALVSLKSKDGKENYSVLFHEIQIDPITEEIIHVDFYQPDLKEEVEVAIPLIFEGIAPAVKELGGTLVRNMTEIEVKSLPANLPQNIIVDVSALKTFDDLIKVENLSVPKNVEIMKNMDEVISLVVPAEKIEEEMEKPTEDVESVEVEKKEKKEEEESE